MAIYLVRGLDTESIVFDALVQIARCDPGLTRSTYDFNLHVSYQQKQPGVPSSNRLMELVNHPWQIYIAGVGSGYINPSSGKPIQNSGGGTTTSAPDLQSYIAVDVADAFGKHYYDLDTNGKKIHSPLPAILYHELAHAYHEFIKKDAPATTANKEQQARADENAFRSQVGLPLEHPTNYTAGGVGTPDYGGVKYIGCPAAVYGGDWQLCSCNIATAALGSPVARQIAAFRRAKRQFEKLTLDSVPLLQPRDIVNTCG
jgi:hypothetical protein